MKSLQRRSHDSLSHSQSHLTLHDKSECNLKPSSFHSNVNFVETGNEDLLDPSNTDSESGSDKDFKVPKKKSANTSQMRIQLTYTALVSNRCGVSDRATAAIASSVLHDFGLITDSDVSHVIDKNKVRRQKQNVRAELCNKSGEF